MNLFQRPPHLRRLIGSLALLCLAATARAARADASPAAPIAVISMFPDDPAELVKFVKKHPVFHEVDLYLGSYGITDSQATFFHSALPAAHYAPIFPLHRKDFPARIRLTAAQLQALTTDYAGPIPAAETLPQSEQYPWGLELGRRMRDYYRERAARVPIDSWQLDEVSPTPARRPDARGANARRFVAGVLRGLAYGRPELNDPFIKGLVFVAVPRGFAELPHAPDVHQLYEAIDEVSLAVMGEEYLPFTGEPAKAATRWYHVQEKLMERGAVGARIAKKYVPVLTPGLRVEKADGDPSGLGGNVHGWDLKKLDAWREDYVRARVEPPVAGLCEYNLVGVDGQPDVLPGVFSALAEGVRHLKEASARRAKSVAP